MTKKRWAAELKGQLFFSHGKSNSCGVAIGFIGTKKIDILSQKKDKNGRLLILEANIDNTAFLLINLYNPNKEKEQVATLNELDNMLESYNNIGDKMIVLGGDFNFFFDISLEAEGGKPSFEKKLSYKIHRASRKVLFM